MKVEEVEAEPKEEKVEAEPTEEEAVEDSSQRSADGNFKYPVTWKYIGYHLEV